MLEADRGFVPSSIVVLHNNKQSVKLKMILRGLGFLLLSYSAGAEWRGLWEQYAVCGSRMPSEEDNCGSYETVKEASAFLVVPASNYCGYSGAELQSSMVGDYRVASLYVGDWIGYDVNLPTSASYRVQFQISSIDGEGAFQLENAFTREIYDTIEDVPYTGDAELYDTISRVVRLPEGSSTLLLRSLQPGWNILSMSIEEIGNFSGFPVKTNGFVCAHGREILDRNGDILHFKGMGLGGWMVHEPYLMLADTLAKSPTAYLDLLRKHMGYTNTDAFRKRWLDNYVTLNDVQELKSLGFNLFQAPLHYDLFTLPIEQEPERGHDTWLLSGFDLLDRLVDWCTQEEIYLIINLQAAPGGQGRASSANDYDESKPSLWEDNENIRKTIAFWREIARRYRGNSWVAGYDLLGAVNWNFEGNDASGCDEKNNGPLKDFYELAIAAIREVDPEHMIILTGNCRGTNHQGIFPVSDDNIALGFQHYWADNSIQSLQGYLEARATYNVPILMTQAGENHNKWYQEAVNLFEDNGIGWSFFPWKKIDSTSSPFTVIGTTLYYTLLDKWRNDGVEILNANQIMLQMADNTKLEQCSLNQAVTLALMGINTECDQTAPSYTVVLDRPERIEAENFCRLQNAVIENTEDELDTGGFNLGWMDKGAIASYKVEIPVDGAYEILYRVASIDGDGGLKIERGGEILGEIYRIPETDNWQQWTDVSHVIQLSSGTQVLNIISTGQGWNLNWFEISLKELGNELAPSITESEVEEKTGN